MSTSSSPDALRPGPRRPHRVVVLCGAGPLHRHTCATLLEAGVRVVGIVVCERKGLRARVAFLRSWARRYGIRKTAGQALGRIVDRVLNRRRDARALARWIDDAANRATIAGSDAQILRTTSYGRADTLEATRRLDPDIFIVHSKFIVGKKVRALAPVAVIGGHPGITPDYRGGYAPFWAVFEGRPDRVGCTVFLIDDGIDTGPVIAQEPIPVDSGEDSHITLAWKGMIREAEIQAATVRKLDRGEPVPLAPVRTVPEGSYYGPPTAWDIARYRMRQRKVR